MKIFLQIALSFFVLTLLIFPAAAQACECTPLDEELSTALVDEAEIIAFGEIMSILPNMERERYDPLLIKPSEDPKLALISVAVSDYYKGDPEQKTVAFYVDLISSCGYNIGPGDFFFVFAARHKGELLQNQICGLPAQKYWPEKLPGK